MSKLISLVSFIFSFFTTATTKANNTESTMNNSHTPNTEPSMFFLNVCLIILFLVPGIVAWQHALTVCPSSDPWFFTNFINGFTVGVVLMATVMGIIAAIVTNASDMTCPKWMVPMVSRIVAPFKMSTMIAKDKEPIMTIRTLMAVVLTVAMFIPMALVATVQESIVCILGLAPLAFTAVDLFVHAEYHDSVRNYAVKPMEMTMSKIITMNVIIAAMIIPATANAMELTMIGNGWTMREIGILFTMLLLLVVMILIPFFIIWQEKQEKAEKLANAERRMAAEDEQRRMHAAAQMMEIRERNIAHAREEAELNARLAEIGRQNEEHRMASLKIQAEMGCKWSQEEIKFKAFIKSIRETKTNNGLWEKFDAKLEEKITFASFMEAAKNLSQNNDYSFFYKNANIQGIRAIWLMIANLSNYEDRTRLVNTGMANLFQNFISTLVKTMKSNDYRYDSFAQSARWNPGLCFDGSFNILTKMEWEAAKTLMDKRSPAFFKGWCFPQNDAAVGGLLIAMSKDPAFADEMEAMKLEHMFWFDYAMSKEKSLWKAAQWKIYAQRYNKVKQLKEDLMPIFALSQKATCKLRADIVVGFNFEAKNFESCDVADVKQTKKILAAGYDQVLRIRRTDAAGIWKESQQINKKYTGNFCTGHGTEQSHGYYQDAFRNGTTIPWVADIMLKGKWDSFGVILTNNEGVVDFGMGNDNRSLKHRPVLLAMFGESQGSLMTTPGQVAAISLFANWFAQREFNINHVAAKIKADLEAAVDNDVW